MASFKLKVLAQPGASRTGVAGWQADELKVRVAAPPEGGRANRALLEYLAGQWGLRPSRIRLLAGQGSRHKLLEAPLEPEAFQRWVGRALEHSSEKKETA